MANQMEDAEETARKARVEAILNAPANPHYVLPETWRDKMAAILTPAYVSPEDLYGGN